MGIGFTRTYIWPTTENERKHDPHDPQMVARANMAARTRRAALAQSVGIVGTGKPIANNANMVTSRGPLRLALPT